MIANQPNQTNKRLISYLIIGVLLLVARFTVGRADWSGTANLHILMEAVGASVALFVGGLAFVQFFTKRNGVYFFIGMGFTGAGLLDVLPHNENGNIGRFIRANGRFPTGLALEPVPLIFIDYYGRQLVLVAT